MVLRVIKRALPVIQDKKGGTKNQRFVSIYIYGVNPEELGG
jgi:hypothetical protein